MFPNPTHCLFKTDLCTRNKIPGGRMHHLLKKRKVNENRKIPPMYAVVSVFKIAPPDYKEPQTTSSSPIPVFRDLASNQKQLLSRKFESEYFMTLHRRR